MAGVPPEVQELLEQAQEFMQRSSSEQRSEKTEVHSSSSKSTRVVQMSSSSHREAHYSSSEALSEKKRRESAFLKTQSEQNVAAATKTSTDTAAKEWTKTSTITEAALPSVGQASKEIVSSVLADGTKIIQGLCAQAEKVHEKAHVLTRQAHAHLQRQHEQVIETPSSASLDTTLATNEGLIVSGVSASGEALVQGVVGKPVTKTGEDGEMTGEAAKASATEEPVKASEMKEEAPKATATRNAAPAVEAIKEIPAGQEAVIVSCVTAEGKPVVQGVVGKSEVSVDKQKPDVAGGGGGDLVIAAVNRAGEAIIQGSTIPTPSAPVVVEPECPTMPRVIPPLEFTPPPPDIHTEAILAGQELFEQKEDHIANAPPLDVAIAPPKEVVVAPPKDVVLAPTKDVVADAPTDVAIVPPKEVVVVPSKEVAVVPEPHMEVAVIPEKKMDVAVIPPMPVAMVPNQPTSNPPPKPAQPQAQQQMERMVQHQQQMSSHAERMSSQSQSFASQSSQKVVSSASNQPSNVQMAYSQVASQQVISQSSDQAGPTVITRAIGYVPVIQGIFKGQLVMGCVTPQPLVAGHRDGSLPQEAGLLGRDPLTLVQGQLEGLRVIGQGQALGGVTELMNEALGRSGEKSHVEMRMSSQRQQQTRTLHYETSSGPRPAGIKSGQEAAMAVQEALLRSIQEAESAIGRLAHPLLSQQPQPKIGAEAGSSHTPPTSPQRDDDRLVTDQEKESMEEGFIDADGNIVVSKKVTRVVTTTKTIYDDGDGPPEVETSRTVEEREVDPPAQGRPTEPTAASLQDTDTSYKAPTDASPTQSSPDLSDRVPTASYTREIILEKHPPPGLTTPTTPDDLGMEFPSDAGQEISPVEELYPQTASQGSAPTPFSRGSGPAVGISPTQEEDETLVEEGSEKDDTEPPEEAYSSVRSRIQAFEHIVVAGGTAAAGSAAAAMASAAPAASAVGAAASTGAAVGAGALIAPAAALAGGAALAYGAYQKYRQTGTDEGTDEPQASSLVYGETQDEEEEMEKPPKPAPRTSIPRTHTETHETTTVIEKRWMASRAGEGAVDSGDEESAGGIEPPSPEQASAAITQALSGRASLDRHEMPTETEHHLDSSAEDDKDEPTRTPEVETSQYSKKDEIQDEKEFKQTDYEYPEPTREAGPTSTGTEDGTTTGEAKADVASPTISSTTKDEDLAEEDYQTKTHDYPDEAASAFFTAEGEHGTPEEAAEQEPTSPKETDETERESTVTRITTITTTTTTTQEVADEESTQAATEESVGKPASPEPAGQMTTEEETVENSTPKPASPDEPVKREAKADVASLTISSTIKDEDLAEEDYQTKTHDYPDEAASAFFTAEGEHGIPGEAVEDEPTSSKETDETERESTVTRITTITTTTTTTTQEVADEESTQAATEESVGKPASPEPAGQMTTEKETVEKSTPEPASPDEPVKPETVSPSQIVTKQDEELHEETYQSQTHDYPGDYPEEAAQKFSTPEPAKDLTAEEDSVSRQPTAEGSLQDAPSEETSEKPTPEHASTVEAVKPETAAVTKQDEDLDEETYQSQTHDYPAHIDEPIVTSETYIREETTVTTKVEVERSLEQDFGRRSHELGKGEGLGSEPEGDDGDQDPDKPSFGSRAADFAKKAGMGAAIGVGAVTLGPAALLAAGAAKAATAVKDRFGSPDEPESPKIPTEIHAAQVEDFEPMSQVQEGVEEPRWEEDKEVEKHSEEPGREVEQEKPAYSPISEPAEHEEREADAGEMKAPVHSTEKEEDLEDETYQQTTFDYPEGRKVSADMQEMSDTTHDATVESQSEAESKETDQEHEDEDADKPSIGSPAAEFAKKAMEATEATRAESQSEAESKETDQEHEDEDADKPSLGSPAAEFAKKAMEATEAATTESQSETESKETDQEHEDEDADKPSIGSPAAEFAKKAMEATEATRAESQSEAESKETDQEHEDEDADKPSLGSPAAEFAKKAMEATEAATTESQSETESKETDQEHEDEDADKPSIGSPAAEFAKKAMEATEATRAESQSEAESKETDQEHEDEDADKPSLGSPAAEFAKKAMEATEAATTESQSETESKETDQEHEDEDADKPSIGSPAAEFAKKAMEATEATRTESQSEAESKETDQEHEDEDADKPSLGSPAAEFAKKAMEAIEAATIESQSETESKETDQEHEDEDADKPSIGSPAAEFAKKTMEATETGTAESQSEAESKETDQEHEDEDADKPSIGSPAAEFAKKAMEATEAASAESQSEAESKETDQEHEDEDADKPSFGSRAAELAKKAGMGAAIGVGAVTLGPAALLAAGASKAVSAVKDRFGSPDEDESQETDYYWRESTVTRAEESTEVSNREERGLRKVGGETIEDDEADVEKEQMSPSMKATQMEKDEDLSEEPFETKTHDYPAGDIPESPAKSEELETIAASETEGGLRTGEEDKIEEKELSPSTTLPKPTQIEKDDDLSEEPFETKTHDYPAGDIPESPAKSEELETIAASETEGGLLTGEEDQNEEKELSPSTTLPKPTQMVKDEDLSEEPFETKTHDYPAGDIPESPAKSNELETTAASEADDDAKETQPEVRRAPRDDDLEEEQYQDKTHDYPASRVQETGDDKEVTESTFESGEMHASENKSGMTITVEEPSIEEPETETDEKQASPKIEVTEAPDNEYDDDEEEKEMDVDLSASDAEHADGSVMSDATTADTGITVIEKLPDTESDEAPTHEDSRAESKTPSVGTPAPPELSEPEEEGSEVVYTDETEPKKQEPSQIPESADVEDSAALDGEESRETVPQPPPGYGEPPPPYSEFEDSEQPPYPAGHAGDYSPAEGDSPSFGDRAKSMAKKVGMGAAVAVGAVTVGPAALIAAGAHKAYTTAKAARSQGEEGHEKELGEPTGSHAMERPHELHFTETADFEPSGSFDNSKTSIFGDEASPREQTETDLAEEKARGSIDLRDNDDMTAVTDAIASSLTADLGMESPKLSSPEEEAVVEDGAKEIGKTGVSSELAKDQDLMDEPYEAVTDDYPKEPTFLEKMASSIRGAFRSEDDDEEDKDGKPVLTVEGEEIPPARTPEEQVADEIAEAALTLDLVEESKEEMETRLAADEASPASARTPEEQVADEITEAALRLEDEEDAERVKLAESSEDIPSEKMEDKDTMEETETEQDITGDSSQSYEAQEIEEDKPDQADIDAEASEGADVVGDGITQTSVESIRRTQRSMLTGPSVDIIKPSDSDEFIHTRTEDEGTEETKKEESGVEEPEALEESAPVSPTGDEMEKVSEEMTRSAVESVRQSTTLPTVSSVDIIKPSESDDSLDRRAEDGEDDDSSSFGDKAKNVAKTIGMGAAAVTLGPAALLAAGAAKAYSALKGDEEKDYIKPSDSSDFSSDEQHTGAETASVEEPKPSALDTIEAEAPFKPTGLTKEDSLEEEEFAAKTADYPTTVKTETEGEDIDKPEKKDEEEAELPIMDLHDTITSIQENVVSLEDEEKDKPFTAETPEEETKGAFSQEQKETGTPEITISEPPAPRRTMSEEDDEYTGRQVVDKDTAASEEMPAESAILTKEESFEEEEFAHKTADYSESDKIVTEDVSAEQAEKGEGDEIIDQPGKDNETKEPEAPSITLSTQYVASQETLEMERSLEMRSQEEELRAKAIRTETTELTQKTVVQEVDGGGMFAERMDSADDLVKAEEAEKAEVEGEPEKAMEVTEPEQHRDSEELDSQSQHSKDAFGQDDSKDTHAAATILSQEKREDEPLLGPDDEDYSAQSHDPQSPTFGDRMKSMAKKAGMGAAVAVGAVTVGPAALLAAGAHKAYTSIRDRQGDDDDEDEPETEALLGGETERLHDDDDVLTTEQSYKPKEPRKSIEREEITTASDVSFDHASPPRIPSPPAAFTELQEATERLDSQRLSSEHLPSEDVKGELEDAGYHATHATEMIKPGEEEDDEARRSPVEEKEKSPGTFVSEILSAVGVETGEPETREPDSEKLVESKEVSPTTFVDQIITGATGTLDDELLRASQDTSIQPWDTAIQEEKMDVTSPVPDIPDEHEIQVTSPEMKEAGELEDEPTDQENQETSDKRQLPGQEEDEDTLAHSESHISGFESDATGKTQSTYYTAQEGGKGTSTEYETAVTSQDEYDTAKSTHESEYTTASGDEDYATPGSRLSEVSIDTIGDELSDQETVTGTVRETDDEGGFFEKTKLSLIYDKEKTSEVGEPTPTQSEGSMDSVADSTKLEKQTSLTKSQTLYESPVQSDRFFTASQDKADEEEDYTHEERPPSVEEQNLDEIPEASESKPTSPDVKVYQLPEIKEEQMDDSRVSSSQAGEEEDADDVELPEGSGDPEEEKDELEELGRATLTIGDDDGDRPISPMPPRSTSEERDHSTEYDRHTMTPPVTISIRHQMEKTTRMHSSSNLVKEHSPETDSTTKSSEHLAESEVTPDDHDIVDEMGKQEDLPTDAPAAAHNMAGSEVTLSEDTIAEGSGEKSPEEDEETLGEKAKEAAKKAGIGMAAAVGAVTIGPAALLAYGAKKAYDSVSERFEKDESGSTPSETEAERRAMDIEPEQPKPYGSLESGLAQAHEESGSPPGTGRSEEELDELQRQLSSDSISRASIRSTGGTPADRRSTESLDRASIKSGSGDSKGSGGGKRFSTSRRSSGGSSRRSSHDEDNAHKHSSPDLQATDFSSPRDKKSQSPSDEVSPAIDYASSVELRAAAEQIADEVLEMTAAVTDESPKESPEAKKSPQESPDDKSAKESPGGDKDADFSSSMQLGDAGSQGVSPGTEGDDYGSHSHGSAYDADYPDEFVAEEMPIEMELSTVPEEPEAEAAASGQMVASMEGSDESPASTLLKYKRKYNSSSNVSEGSLAEFERLERELVMRGDGSLSSSEADLLISSRRKGSDGSLNSLNEFEKLEREMVDQGPSADGSPAPGGNGNGGGALPDVMLLSDIHEESEPEDMSIRGDDEEDDSIMQLSGGMDLDDALRQGTGEPLFEIPDRQPTPTQGDEPIESTFEQITTTTSEDDKQGFTSTTTTSTTRHISHIISSEKREDSGFDSSAMKTTTTSASEDVPQISDTDSVEDGFEHVEHPTKEFVPPEVAGALTQQVTTEEEVTSSVTGPTEVMLASTDSLELGGPQGPYPVTRTVRDLDSLEGSEGVLASDTHDKDSLQDFEMVEHPVNPNESSTVEIELSAGDRDSLEDLSKAAPEDSELVIVSNEEAEAAARFTESHPGQDHDSVIASSISGNSSQDMDGSHPTSQDTHGMLSGDTVGTYQEYGQDEGDRDSLSEELGVILGGEPRTPVTEGPPSFRSDTEGNLTRDIASAAKAGSVYGSSATLTGGNGGNGDPLRDSLNDVRGAADYQPSLSMGGGGLGTQVQQPMFDMPTTLTTFTTSKQEDDGSMEIITRTVTTAVTDPVSHHVRFTGTDSEAKVQEYIRHIREQQGMDLEEHETVDDEGNVTRTVIRRVRQSPGHGPAEGLVLEGEGGPELVGSSVVRTVTTSSFGSSGRLGSVGTAGYDETPSDPLTSPGAQGQQSIGSGHLTTAGLAVSTLSQSPSASGGSMDSLEGSARPPQPPFATEQE